MGHIVLNKRWCLCSPSNHDDDMLVAVTTHSSEVEDVRLSVFAVPEPKDALLLPAPAAAASGWICTSWQVAKLEEGNWRTYIGEEMWTRKMEERNGVSVQKRHGAEGRQGMECRWGRVMEEQLVCSNICIETVPLSGSLISLKIFEDWIPKWAYCRNILSILRCSPLQKPAGQKRIAQVSSEMFTVECTPWIITRQFREIPDVLISTQKCIVFNHLLKCCASVLYVLVDQHSVRKTCRRFFFLKLSL